MNCDGVATSMRIYCDYVVISLRPLRWRSDWNDAITMSRRRFIDCCDGVATSAMALLFLICQYFDTYKKGGHLAFRNHFILDLWVCNKQIGAVQGHMFLNLGLAIIVRLQRRRRQRRIARRTVWVKHWLLRHPMFGQFEQLLQELHREDERGYRNILRVPPRLFMELVEHIGILLVKVP